MWSAVFKNTIGRISNRKIAKKFSSDTHFGLQTKVLILLGVISVLSTAILTLLSMNVADKMIMQSSSNKLTSDVRIGLTLFNNQFNGSWNVLDGALWKGATKLSNNEQIVETMSQELGDAVTIFSGNKPIATTIKNKNGSYALTVKPSSQVVQTVLDKGQSYSDEEVIAGQAYQTAYEPIRDNQGKTLGMWLVGVPLGQLINQENELRDQIVVVGILLLLIGLAVGLVMIRRISKPLSNLVHVTHTIADGNLTETVNITSRDEVGSLGKSFNTMIMSLRKLIREVDEASKQLILSAQDLKNNSEHTVKANEQVNSVIQETAAGADKQAVEVDKIVEGVAAIMDRAQSISVNAARMSSSAAEASSTAASGNDSIALVVGQMNSIHTTVDELAGMVKGLGEQSKQIEDIIGVVAHISSETNLLALNAAIEAARAGEQGRGFAVVAGQVKNLAEQSTQSARQISTIVRVIQKETQRVADSMQATRDEVNTGMQKVHAAGGFFGQISNSVDIVAGQTREVTVALQQMTAGTEELKNRIQTVETVTQETNRGMQTVFAATEEQLALMQEITASASSLNQMANTLEELVGRFKVN